MHGRQRVPCKISKVQGCERRRKRGEGGTVHFHVLLSVCLLHVVITTGRDWLLPFLLKLGCFCPHWEKIQHKCMTGHCENKYLPL